MSTAGTSAPSGRRSLLAALIAVALAAIAVAVIGGYGMRWKWTGFTKDRQLWDVLHLLVLPVAVAVAPLWWRTRNAATRVWRWVCLIGLCVFIVLVIGGYALGWTWTGFAGNTLWDWLELLVLPVTVALLPLWYETHRRLAAEWRIGFVVLAVAFVVVVVGGYVYDWAWTGFAGNTLRDWIQLLLVPFVMPAALVIVAARIAEAEDQRVENTPTPTGM